MSGHNKWSKIKHKKAATDAKKSKEFGKLARLLAVESKKSGGDTSSSGLRAAIEKARGINMPNDNIERAIKKGAGGDMSTMDEVLYEVYGPGGSAIIIDGLTDNNNRMAQEIKHILSERGISLAGKGAASWAFEKNDGRWTAKTTVTLPDEDKEKLSALVEALNEHEDIQNIYTNAV